MNKKLYIIFIVILIACPIFILVLANLSSVNDLMNPPNLYGNNAKIQKAFETSINKDESDIILKYPSEGDFKSAYIMYDIDDDGTNEAMVFYSLKSDETTIHINLLDYTDGKWVSKSDTTGYGSEVISVSFDDLNNDGQKEIIICWSLYDSKANKILTVQDCTENKKIVTMKTLANETYSCMKLIDIDGDGQKEIFISTLGSTTDTTKAYARVFKMQNNKISSVGEVSLDGTISGYSSIKIQKKNSQNPTMVFLDAYKGESQMITEVVYWDSASKSLAAPLLDSQNLTNTKTLRSTGIASMDIDDDGQIEIPTPYTSSLASVSPEKNLNNVGITQWSDIINNNLQIKSYSIVNYNDFYILMLDKSLINNFVAYNDQKQRSLTVYSYDGTAQKQGAKLFSIITVSVSDWTKNPTEGYSLLKRNDSLVYAYKITEEGQNAGIQSDLLIKNIKIIS